MANWFGDDTPGVIVDLQAKTVVPLTRVCGPPTDPGLALAEGHYAAGDVSWRVRTTGTYAEHDGTRLALEVILRSEVDDDIVDFWEGFGDALCISNALREPTSQLMEHVHTVMDGLRWLSGHKRTQYIPTLYYGQVVFRLSLDDAWEQKTTSLTSDPRAVDVLSTAREINTSDDERDRRSFPTVEEVQERWSSWAKSRKLSEDSLSELDALLKRMLFGTTLFVEPIPNQRARFLMNVVALETAVKAIIAERVPRAEWFVDEAPSPPVTKILKNYLPDLGAFPKKQNLPSKHKKLAHALDSAVGLRNKLAHGGRSYAGEPTPDAVKRLSPWIETAIEVALLYLEQHRGFTWPEDRLRALTIGDEP